MPTATYIPLATITLTSADSQIDFANIPNTYRDLVLVVTGTSASWLGILGRINGSSAAIYNAVRMTGSSGGAQSAISYSNGTFLDLASADGTGNTGSQFSVIAQYLDYSANDKHKTVLTRGNTGGATVQATAARWAANDVINSISVLFSSAGTYAVGSTFSLYGIAG